MHVYLLPPSPACTVCTTAAALWHRMVVRIAWSHAGCTGHVSCQGYVLHAVFWLLRAYLQISCARSRQRYKTSARRSLCVKHGGHAIPARLIVS